MKVKGKKILKLVVLVNGGAESKRPCLVVDLPTAKRLGFWPPEKAEVFSVEEASHIGDAYLIRDAVRLELMDEKDNRIAEIKSDLVIHIGLSEPLITDTTIDALGIQIISFGKGLWRHISDPPNIVRKSAHRL